MKPIVIILMGTLLPMSGFAQTVGSYYLYTHDNVGNIISREKALSQNRQRNVSVEEAASRNAGTDSLVTIKADASWSEVQIEIKGERSPGETLSIYSSEGSSSPSCEWSQTSSPSILRICRKEHTCSDSVETRI